MKNTIQPAIDWHYHDNTELSFWIDNLKWKSYEPGFILKAMFDRGYINDFCQVGDTTMVFFSIPAHEHLSVMKSNPNSLFEMASGDFLSDAKDFFNRIAPTATPIKAAIIEIFELL